MNVNLFRTDLTEEQIEVLKFGLRHDLTTRPNTLEMKAISKDTCDHIKATERMEGTFYGMDS